MRAQYVMLVLGSLVACALGQTPAPTNANGEIDKGDSFWNLLRHSGTAATQPKYDISTVTPAEPVGKRVMQAKFTVAGSAANSIRMIAGVAFNLCPSTLFCGSNGNNNQCLPDNYRSPGWPANGVNYLSIGCKKLMLSFTNPDAGDTVNPCKASMMDSFCETRQECQAWNSANSYATVMADQVTNSKTNPIIKATPTNLVKTVTRPSGRTRRYQLKFELEMDDTFFGNNDLYNLGLDNGDYVYTSFAIWYSGTTQTCSDDFHRSMFAVQPNIVTMTGTTSTAFRTDIGKVRFVTVTAPTPSPTTQKPTKSPTTGKPTRAPVTPKPTTPPPPTRSPTTKKPTTPIPTAPPTEVGCPVENQWNQCTYINNWFAKRGPDERTQRRKEACQQYGCYWCSYEKLTEGSQNCRPRFAWPKGGQSMGSKIRMEKSYVCPADQSIPYEKAGCQLFGECPSKQAMSACKALNFDGPNGGLNYKGPRCEGGFTTTYNGQEFTAKAKECAYDKGICRAIGPYWDYRKTLFTIPGYFTKVLKCPFETALPTIPQIAKNGG